MTSKPITRDERTLSVENASYRWAYLLLSYGLLLSAAYRGFVTHESSWDLLALVIVGGGVSSLHQGSERVLTRRWAALSLAAIAIAAVIAAAIVFIK